MSFLKTYASLLKRYARFRFLTFCLAVITAVAVFLFVGQKSAKEPFISSINPPLGLPGDTLIIEGSNFGFERNTSYVEIAGSNITRSKYLSWTDSKISVVLPDNVQDGLVLVKTDAGESNPAFFASKSSIPVAIRTDPKITIPVIQSITPEKACIGETIIITGSNFGSTRGSSCVYFTANRTQNVSTNPMQHSDEFISASKLDFDYELWTDSEIHVRIPDGANTGKLYVETERGKSANQTFTVNFPAGKKSFSSQRTYLVQTDVNIKSNAVEQDSLVTLYMPRPPVFALQPAVELTSVTPTPLIADDLYNVIFQCRIKGATETNQAFSQTAVVKLFSCTSNIESKKISSYTDKNRLLYKAYTTPDSIILSTEPQIQELKESIIGKQKNPYAQAKLIYDYLIQNYEITNTIRTGNISILDLLKNQKGDAYDFAILFTTLCRAAGIPAVPISGIILENQNTTRSHWWAEIYFEKYGWFPVDVSLGAGLQYNAFTQIEDVKGFYFGNLDSQHIAFARGWNQIKQSSNSSKTVQRPRSYAMQSIWEEAGDSTANYSSLWNDPVIIGIY